MWLLDSLYSVTGGYQLHLLLGRSHREKLVFAFLCFVKSNSDAPFWVETKDLMGVVIRAEKDKPTQGRHLNLSQLSFG